MKASNHPLTVSVVIPAYNEAERLALCLEHVLNQTHPAVEIIVVDNNSTDATAEIASRFPRVKLIRETRQGIAHARNAGFNAARCDIIARIDADTLVPKDWISNLRLALDNSEIVGVSGRAKFYDHPFGLAADAVFNFCNRWLNILIGGQPILWGSNMAMRRAAWLKVRNGVNNSNRVWEDIDLSMRLRDAGRIIYAPGLAVQSSARSLLASPREIISYLARWPRTYAQFGWRAKLLSRLVFVSVILLSPSALPFYANEWRRRFNLGSLLRPVRERLLANTPRWY